MRVFPDEFRAIVDPAVDAVIGSLREIVCDYPETEDEHILTYALLKLMNNLYSSGKHSDVTTVLGILETVKQEYFRVHSVMTSQLPTAGE